MGWEWVGNGWGMGGGGKEVVEEVWVWVGGRGMCVGMCFFYKDLPMCSIFFISSFSELLIYLSISLF